MLKGITDYDRRESTGRAVEDRILDTLKSKYGYKIEHASKQDNIQRGIDGWWTDKSGRKNSIQVKFRQGGDDIIFEAIKDIDGGVVGRDTRSEANYYLIMDTGGKTILFEMPPIKLKAKELTDLAIKDWETDGTKRFWSGNGWQMRVQRGDRGNEKLMLYLRKNLFHPVATWELNVSDMIKEDVLNKALLKSLLS